MDKRKWRILLRMLRDALVAPNGKQKQAYCEWFHTLSAACIVGAVWIVFSKPSAHDFWHETANVVVLIFCAVIFLIAGAILGKGE